MIDEEDVVLRAAGLLDALGIPYMIAGSVASSFHGRPRTTHDADIVIDPAPDALDRLVTCDGPTSLESRISGSWRIVPLELPVDRSARNLSSVRASA